MSVCMYARVYICECVVITLARMSGMAILIYDTSTSVVQKVLQMLGFHRYKSLILAQFVMLE